MTSTHERQGLDEAQLPWRSIVRAAADGVIVLDVEGIIHSANAAAAALLSVAEVDVVGRPVVDFVAVPEVSSEVPAEWLAQLRDVAAADTPRNIVVGVPESTGRPRPLDVVLSRAGDGLIVAVVRDARARLRAQKELRLYQRAVSLTAEAIVYTDRHGVIRIVNRAFVELTGYSVAEAVGQTPSLLKSGRHSGGFYEQMWSTLLGGEVWRGDLVNRRKDGSEYTASLTISPIIDREGKLHGYVGIHYDVSEARQAEEDLASARDDAEQAARAKTEFLANMSHEIRTPMNAIVGMTELLGDTRLDIEQRDYVGTIAASADSLLRIINDILDFSKLEAGKLQLEQIDFDLPRLVDQVAQAAARRAHEKDLELACMVYSHVPSQVRGDPTRLRQVLLNLTSNAIKFTHTGEVVIRARTETLEDTRVVVRFEVQDTGIGIPADRRHVLFDAFTQVDASTTREFGGTGLGLAICKQIVGLLGGELGVESEPGQGSTFWFTVPLDAPSEGTAPPRKPKIDLRGLRVLLVDDNATNRRIVATHLGSWGCRVDAVASGAAALEMLLDAARDGDPFSVGVFDYQMPGMDGEELARRVTQEPLTRNIELVLLASMSTGGKRERMQAAGFAACLSKPVTRDRLLRALEASAARIHDQVLRESSTSALRAGAQGELGGRVLLVEDNEVNRKVATRMLEKLGLIATMATNGQEAVDILKGQAFDLVLTDVQMPVMDGFELAAAIREMAAERQLDLPVIAMTAHAMVGDRERCIAAGMHGYVSKPVKLERLREALAPWLAAKPDDCTIDRVVLLESADDDEEFAQELLEIFAATTREHVEQLSDAVESGDATSLRRHAHTVKGSSASVGATGLRDLAEQMEKLAANEDLDAARELVDRLVRVFEGTAANCVSSEPGE